MWPLDRQCCNVAGGEAWAAAAASDETLAAALQDLKAAQVHLAPSLHTLQCGAASGGSTLLLLGTLMQMRVPWAVIFCDKHEGGRAEALRLT